MGASGDGVSGFFASKKPLTPSPTGLQKKIPKWESFSGNKKINSGMRIFFEKEHIVCYTWKKGRDAVWSNVRNIYKSYGHGKTNR